ncbi:uncharacterized protein HD556DRAFT_1357288 [Suillus plorans]|uniref:Secreted protein n=1 Tax=Suillus plorans TaxID=116603 RepID=A0A9P7DK97_9AGAM|nr:uncharacterized protein HD556DRAFT_1357288 [Suillus plorans]KAG1796940.1 hypothetical protein HD556DRAFT_1357288 [Suillus plorans]
MLALASFILLALAGLGPSRCRTAYLCGCIPPSTLLRLTFNCYILIYSTVLNSCLYPFFDACCLRWFLRQACTCGVSTYSIVLNSVTIPLGGPAACAALHVFVRVP